MISDPNWELTHGQVHLGAHDAWNRLVKAESGTVSGGSTTWTTTGQYQYNGLHWRVVADGDRATPTGLDQRRTMYYSAGWQLLQEDVDDFTNGESPDGVNSRSQEVWGLRYIDDSMVRLLDKNVDVDCRDSGELFWQLNDAQFSTVAVIDKNAVLQERVSYTSYGVGTHRWPHEVNNTGGVTTSGGTSDYGVIDGLAQANSGAGTPINDPNGNYNVAADLNRDGVIDSTDTSIFTSTFGGAKSALASGIISDPSGPDNVFGYDGYVYNADQGLYTVRFRWYSPTFGRWLERDPLGYIDGVVQFEYVRSAPHGRKDPLGLTDKKDADDWWDDWRKRFPGYTDDQLKELRETFDRGCIGITCLYLGEKGNPSLQNCFATFGQAQGRQREMKSNGECSGKRGPEGNCDSEPQIFSVRFYSGGRTFKPDPTNGKIDMSQWTYEAKPGFVNFDYGYFDAVRGVWIHANHCAPGMIVYESVLSHYSRPLQDFDNQAFCVACEDFGKPGRLPAEPIKWDWKWWWSLF